MASKACNIIVYKKVGPRLSEHRDVIETQTAVTLNAFWKIAVSCLLTTSIALFTLHYGVIRGITARKS